MGHAIWAGERIHGHLAPPRPASASGRATGMTVLVWLLLVAVWQSLTGPAVAGNWPQWRGPYGNSFCSERSVPVVWSEQRGLAWKQALPAWGNSSPIVWDRSVFVTSHTDDGRLLLLHIGAQTGVELWTRQVGTGTTPRDGPKRGQQHFHQSHNLATPSPVTNGKVVVAHFGNGMLAAYDFDGGELWKRDLQQDYGAYTIWWGHANSPVIYEDLVISVCMQDSLADLQDQPVESYVVANELATGRTRWKTARPTDAVAEQCDAYTTPILTEIGGQPRLLIMGGNQLDAYDPRTGTQVWFLPGQVGGRTVTSPTITDQFVIATRGKRGSLFALQLEQNGELSRRDLLWTNDQGTPDSCSPVAHRALIFTVSDDGIVRCLDAPSGKLQWKQRLPGTYRASPIWCEGRILLLNTDGLCTVIAAAGRYSKLFENQLDDRTIASPAIANGHIYIRGHKQLYCIGPTFR